MAKTQSTVAFDWDHARSVAEERRRRFAVDELSRHPRFNWVGIYRVEGNDLVLHEWKGPEATEHTRIPVGQGICGLAARTGETVNVPDVNADPRYLSCFPSTRSELVVPITSPDGTVIGEIDIDSDTPGEFSAAEVDAVERVATWLGGGPPRGKP
jgi:GAF domain-containing protein